MPLGFSLLHRWHPVGRAKDAVTVISLFCFFPRDLLTILQAWEMCAYWSLLSGTFFAETKRLRGKKNVKGGKHSAPPDCKRGWLRVQHPGADPGDWNAARGATSTSHMPWAKSCYSVPPFLHVLNGGSNRALRIELWRWNICETLRTRPVVMC